ncbi:shikimate kinase [Candidatus Pelagibacter sp.]|nr:shikimate kinase [Candidatus Pelagibacter sp.]
MKSKENIVFLGMMGSGKTSIGSLVSKKLKLNFFDIDRQIENKLGMKISKIFETKGEKFFREFEEIMALKILKRSKIVISLGGGTFMNKKVRKEILTNHLSFWLQWDNETLIKRIKNSKKRPIAIQYSKDELLDLIKKRSSIYSKARYKINCDNLTKFEIVEKVIKNL